MKNAYGSDLEDLGGEDNDAVYAAERRHLDHSLTAMTHHIGEKLKKQFHDVTWQDVHNHGLLAKISFGDEVMDQQGEFGDPRGGAPYTAEPGDYYSRDPVGVDHTLTGATLLRKFRRHGYKTPMDEPVFSGATPRIFSRREQKKINRESRDPQMHFRFEEVDGLIATLLEGQVMVGNFPQRAPGRRRKKKGGGQVATMQIASKHLVRNPSETLAGNQLPAEDLLRYLPDSYPAQQVGGQTGVKMVTQNTRTGRRKEKPLTSTIRRGTGTGSFIQSGYVDPDIGKSLGIVGHGDVERYPKGDRFTVTLAHPESLAYTPKEERGGRQPWRDILTKVGLPHFHPLLDTMGDKDDRSDFVNLHFDDPHSAIASANLLDDAGVVRKVRVTHDRKFLPAPDGQEWHEVGKIDHWAGSDRENNMVTYSHSLHAVLDHAAEVGRPHRCPGDKAFGSRCGVGHGCRHLGG